MSEPRPCPPHPSSPQGSFISFCFCNRVEEPWVGTAGVLALLEVCTQASGNITEIR